MEDADRSDIDATLAGEESAYARLVRRYEGRVTQLMWRFSRDTALCEELVQEVFVEAYFSLKSYRGEAPFFHWLRKIGTRAGYRFWKRREKDKGRLSLQDLDRIETKGDSLDPAEAGRILDSLLARLPHAERLVLTLMYFEDCGTEEIARRMGWSRPMVKMRAYRARKKINESAERENLLEDLKWIH
jgi:RNA polymerase sigma-70 factor (ECF subfamily)